MAIDTVNSLTTLADVKTWCGVTVIDYDSILEDLIDSVSWQFNSFCNRKIKARDITGYYDGDGSDTLVTPEYPINSITHIYVDTDRDFTSDTEVTDYVYNDNGRIVLTDDSFTTTEQANKIEYNAGYSTIPYDLQVACKDQVKFLFRRHRDNREGVSTESNLNGNVTMTEVGEMLTTVLEVVKRYRKEDHIS